MKKILIIVSLFVIAILSVSFIFGCASTTDSTTTTTASSATTTTTTTIATHALVGTWVGTWEDTVYSLDGALSGTITQSGALLSGTGTIELSDLSVSGITIEVGTATGTISGTSVTFSLSSTTVGTGSGTVSGSTISGTGTVIAPIDYGAFTFTGTVDASGNSVTGVFDFTSPTGGSGTATVTKQ